MASRIIIDEGPLLAVLQKHDSSICYLKDRKGRKLVLDETNHYMKVAKAIRLTIELQGKVDEVYAKVE